MFWGTLTLRILYIIDERGLTGGAHIATELLIAALKNRGYIVDIMEAVHRNSFWGIIQRSYSRILSIFHISESICRNPLFFHDPFGLKFRHMKRYDTVCVMSENSALAPIVAKLPREVRKVQMIHTNYPLWSKVSHRNIKEDGKLFEKFDCIACVGVIGASQFEEMFPLCKGKVFPFHNIINYIKEKRTDENKLSHYPIRLISLVRINDKKSKDGPRMIRVAKRLYDSGVKFVWDNYGGGGVGFKECQQEILRLGLDNVFRIHSHDPEARFKISSADIFVLLSHYEGLPNVIYEALLSGTPVFSTNVGGIAEQIDDGINGWLVKDDEDTIFYRLSEVMSDVTSINNAKYMAKKYVYDNDKVILEHVKILSK